MRALVRCLLAAFAIGFLALPATADEVIKSFDSDVRLLKDGTVDVTETLVVQGEGYRINHGIYRDIPTVLINDDGSTLNSGLDIVNVSRDGRQEPWHSQYINNGVRIYIGDPDITLSPGMYRYAIHYTLTRIGRSFADHDELYWNATGNFWDFPIENAFTRVTLPEGAVISDLSAYTGVVGSREHAVEITRLSDDTATFRATRTLRPGEGMTVSASFQAGILTRPSGTTAMLYYLSDHRRIVIPGIAIFLVLLYYFFAWDAVGRDPRKGTVIPLFHPPKGFSPALTHYVWAWGWRNNGWQAFTAALVDLGIKGFLEIGKSGRKTTFAATGKRDGVSELPPGEAVIFDYFDGQGKVTVDKRSGPSIGSTRDSFTEAIETENRQVYFRNNYLYVGLGVALSILCLLAMLALGVLAFEWLVAGIFASVFLTIIISTLRNLFLGTGIGRFFQLAIIGFFFVNFVLMGKQAWEVFPEVPIDVPAVAAATIIAINLVFAVLMRAPTVQGRKVMDRIEGFRMYLETAEKERLNFVGEPELTRARFEGILPYAIALGVEEKWSERFQNELARHAVRDVSGSYTPVWYSGSDFSPSSLGRDVAGIASGMSAAMASAQPSSSSSSGSGGGGSSGGGGGGGGGGGW